MEVESSRGRRAVFPWVLAARPKTLTAAIVPVLVGTACADWQLRQSGKTLFSEGSLWLACAALLSACAIQIGTNYVNDAIDFKRGADNAERLGPVRATQQGLLTAQAMMQGAWVAFLIALLFGAVLVVAAGGPILVIGMISLICGYAYTGGPYPLAYRGLGDLFVLIFFGIIAVMGSAYLQTGGWEMSALVAGLQVGLLAVVLIAINNLRDRQGDREVGKRTLAVILGEKGARVEILCACVAPIVLGGYWWVVGATLVGLCPLVAAPLLWKVARGIWSTPPGSVFNQYLAQAAAAHALFGSALAVGFFLS